MIGGKRRSAEESWWGVAERAKTISKELLAMLISVIPTVQPSRYSDPKAGAAAALEYVQYGYIPHLSHPIVKQS